MSSTMSLLDQGLIFSLVAVAVYISSRVIQKDDLTTEGSFGIGGALCAVLSTHNVSPILVLIASLLGGGLSGMVTGILYAKLRMNHLMAGLITTTACFSVSLVIASANKIVAQENSIFSLFSTMLSPTISEIVVLGVISILVIALISLFLRSEIGLLLRTTGENPHVLVKFGKSADTYYLLGFSLANAITALAGALFVQWSGFFSITGNIGTLVTGLATLMMAELVSRRISFVILLASIAYQSVFVVTLSMGMPPVWNNLIKAGLMVALVALSGSLSRHRLRRQNA